MHRARSNLKSPNTILQFSDPPLPPLRALSRSPSLMQAPIPFSVPEGDWFTEFYQ